MPIINKVKSKIPKLRFQGFEGEWEEKKLEVISIFQNGKAHEEDVVENGEYIIVNSKFISTNGEIKKYTNYAHSLLNSDTVVLVMSDVPNGKALAKCYYIETENKYSLNQRICSIKGVGVKTKYLYYKLNRNPYYIEFDNGVGQTNLRKDDVLNCPVQFPTNELEQQKIADFLTSVDERIDSLSRKKELLEQYKKGVMQKVFSQKLRFKQTDGSDFPDWEEKRLGELVKVLKGSNLSKNDLNDNGTEECVLYGELFTKYKIFTNKIISRTNVVSGARSLAGDILMPTSDVTPQGLATSTAIMKSNVLLGGDINILRPSIKINSIFLSYILNNNKKSIMELVSGTTIKHIYSKDIQKLKISLPHFDEQQKITDFITALDEQIDQVNQQIQKTKTFKKALLQQMFV
ncbi:MAG: restriction endonuclease subunit S [Patescibacteria group bacterium]